MKMFLEMSLNKLPQLGQWRASVHLGVSGALSLGLQSSADVTIWPKHSIFYKHLNKLH